MVRKKAVFRDKECSFCGLIFTPTCGSKKLCSPDCVKRESARRAKTEPVRYNLKCEVCGRDFVNRLKIAKACSANCRTTREKIKAKKAYLLKKEDRLSKAKIYYEENREVILEYVSRYAQENKEKVSHYKSRNRHKRRLAIKNKHISFSQEELDLRWKYFGDRCAYCGSSDKKLCMDHVKPLSKGGWHCLSNLRPACASCNSKKSAKWPYAVIPKVLPGERKYFI